MKILSLKKGITLFYHWYNRKMKYFLLLIRKLHKSVKYLIMTMVHIIQKFHTSVLLYFYNHVKCI